MDKYVWRKLPICGRGGIYAPPRKIGLKLIKPYIIHAVTHIQFKQQLFLKNGNLQKQEGAELCQAQPAKHKVFGSNGAIFFGLNC